MCDHSKQSNTKPHTQAVALAGFQVPSARQWRAQPTGGGGGRKPALPSLESQDPRQGRQQVEAGNEID